MNVSIATEVIKDYVNFNKLMMASKQAQLEASNPNGTSTAYQIQAANNRAIEIGGQMQVLRDKMLASKQMVDPVVAVAAKQGITKEIIAYGEPFTVEGHLSPAHIDINTVVAIMNEQQGHTQQAQQNSGWGNSQNSGWGNSGYGQDSNMGYGGNQPAGQNTGYGYNQQTNIVLNDPGTPVNSTMTNGVFVNESPTAAFNKAKVTALPEGDIKLPNGKTVHVMNAHTLKLKRIAERKAREESEAAKSVAEEPVVEEPTVNYTPYEAEPTPSYTQYYQEPQESVSNTTTNTISSDLSDTGYADENGKRYIGVDRDGNYFHTEDVYNKLLDIEDLLKNNNLTRNMNRLDDEERDVFRRTTLELERVQKELATLKRANQNIRSKKVDDSNNDEFTPHFVSKNGDTITTRATAAVGLTNQTENEYVPLGNTDVLEDLYTYHSDGECAFGWEELEGEFDIPNIELPTKPTAELLEIKDELYSGDVDMHDNTVDIKLFNVINPGKLYAGDIIAKTAFITETEVADEFFNSVFGNVTKFKDLKDNFEKLREEWEGFPLSLKALEELDKHLARKLNKHIMGVLGLAVEMETFTGDMGKVLNIIKTGIKGDNKWVWYSRSLYESLENGILKGFKDYERYSVDNITDEVSVFNLHEIGSVMEIKGEGVLETLKGNMDTGGKYIGNRAVSISKFNHGKLYNKLNSVYNMLAAGNTNVCKVFIDNKIYNLIKSLRRDEFVIYEDIIKY